MSRIEALREQYAAHGNRVWSWDSIPQACKHEPSIPTFWGPSGGFATAGEMDLACNTMESLGLLLRAVDAARAIGPALDSNEQTRCSGCVDTSADGEGTYDCPGHYPIEEARRNLDAALAALESPK